MSDADEVVLDLDPFEFEFACPRCSFYNPLTFRDARLGTPLICRGCKNTLMPDDAWGELDDARRRIADSIRELQESLKGAH
jgi:hypothetical protein